jgi:adenine-specific DNA methylase
MPNENYPKRLIEVDLPIKRISEHARREKSIRHGHISTLHIWWARRPLAACRAVICAALWPDPADPLCPQRFRDDACQLINDFARKAAIDKDLAEHCSEEVWGKWQTIARNGGLNPQNEDHWNVLRNALLDFIADFSNWDNSTVPEYIETSRGLTQSAHEALGGAPGTKPLVADPFAGGGSIPLEALRVGADAFASDLNPVAVLLNKVVLEYIPKYGQRLADEVRKGGEWIKAQAERELTQFYPEDADGSTPIAYLWARTITCEGPGCGAEVPLMRSLWLTKKGKDSVALRFVPRPRAKRIDFEIVEKPRSAEVPEGTVRRSAATCPLCGYTTPADHVRDQFLTRGGGANDSRLAAVVAQRPLDGQTKFRLASEHDERAFHAAMKCLQRESQSYTGLSAIPDEPLPYLRSIFNINLLGVDQWGKLFNGRQALALLTLTEKTKAAIERLAISDDHKLPTAVGTCLALAIDRCADYWSSLAVWAGDFVAHTFGRQALGIIWDYAEVNGFADASGSYTGAVDWICRVIEKEGNSLLPVGHVQLASACQHPLPNDSVQAFVTDPPYYDAVPYADLSDFFYVWLKRSIGKYHQDLFAEPLSPKNGEVVQLAERNPQYSYKTREYFEDLMTRAMSEGRRTLRPDGVGLVVFAHKTTTGWETQIKAMIDAGWTVTGSWPIDTERPGRLRANNAAALASSVHLVCRPRTKGDSGDTADAVADWRDVLAQLPRRIHEWMPRLASEGVVGADAIFACLGPALEIFSRYERVEKASGEQVALREYLEYVWAAVAKEALNMIFEGADATGFEEDARLTAMWLWTLSTGTNGKAPISDESEGEEDEEVATTKKAKLSGYLLEYDAARKIAQGLGAHLERLTSLVEIMGEITRLLPVSERTRHLFGKEEGATPTKRKAKPKQMSFTDILDEAEEEGGWGEKNAPKAGTTVLDRVHQSMILFAAGRNEALKRFLVTDGAGRDSRFWHLADALCKLYPTGTDERRWVEGVMARKKSLGF